MVSHDLPRYTATNQAVLDQRDLHSITEFVRAIDTIAFA